MRIATRTRTKCMKVQVGRSTKVPMKLASVCGLPWNDFVTQELSSGVVGDGRHAIYGCIPQDISNDHMYRDMEFRAGYQARMLKCTCLQKHLYAISRRVLQAPGWQEDLSSSGPDVMISPPHGKLG